jgi:N-methylhydantoinase B
MSLALELTIFHKVFAAVAEEMGIVLRRSAFSPNIKERRDYSCAVFTPAGELLAQAAHIPVHLGALPATLARVLPDFPLAAGDVLLLNDPYWGGTHLPDITLIAPVYLDNCRGRARGPEAPSPSLKLPSQPPFPGSTGILPVLGRAGSPSYPSKLRERGRGFGKGGRGPGPLVARAASPWEPPFPSSSQPAFYLANRAHHADVGGQTPGSMPLAQDLREEGVIIPPTYLYRHGIRQEEVWQGLLAQMRVPQEREGDLAAQLAALTRGEERCQAIARRYGLEKLRDMSQALLAYSETAMRALIQDIPDGVYSFTDYLDDDGWGNEDLAVHLDLTIARDRARLDFTRSAPQARGGVNAVPPVVEAACYYVFLTLLAEEYPINQGCFRPLQVLTREGSLLQPRFPAPVAAGNVETSQRLVDAVLGALAQAIPGLIPAASQGTMNNLAFGGVHPETGREFTYYETLGGGAGGHPGGPGISAIHSHMTNTRNTPIEVLEHDYPVLVERYAIRENSGGAGGHPGGLGLIRDFRFLSPVRVSLLTERRRHAPYGLAGGRPGGRGENLLITPKREEKLPGKVNLTLPAGSVLSIRTPGGGGWGKKKA